MKLLKLASALVFSLGLLMFNISCTEEDSCETISCENGGDCTEGICSCLTGYEGDNCSVEVRDKFEGNWNYSNSCDSMDVSSMISEVADKLLEVKISNLTGLNDTETKANIDGNNIFITEQTVKDENEDIWIISAETATLSDQSFSLIVDFVFDGQRSTCQLDFTK